MTSRVVVSNFSHPNMFQKQMTVQTTSCDALLKLQIQILTLTMYQRMSLSFVLFCLLTTLIISLRPHQKKTPKSMKSLFWRIRMGVRRLSLMLNLNASDQAWMRMLIVSTSCPKKFGRQLEKKPLVIMTDSGHGIGRPI